MRDRAITSRVEAVDHELPTTVYRWARRRENLSLVLIDLGVITAAWLLALAAGFEADISEPVVDRLLLVVGPPIVLQLVVHRAVGLYGPVWRYASIDEAVRVMVAVACGILVGFAWFSIVDDTTTLSLPVLTAPPVAALLILVGCGGVRFQSRLFALERQRTRAAKPVQALIVGAGSPGAALAYELSQTESGRDVHVVGFVDDDSRLHRRSLRGIPVLGGTGQLEDLSRRHGVDRIFIALPHAEREQVKPIVDRALRTRAQVKVLRPAASTAAGMLQNLRDIDLSDLVGRQPAPVDTGGIGEYLTGATVLVTGAGGSIGSEICRQVARYRPGRLLLLDRDETLLHDVVTGDLASPAETVLLDLCNRERMVALLQEARPDVVFHAAANKHVPILERYPSQAAATNVLSTWWLANAAAECGTQRFVHLSTDKAARPTSVMGATKRAAEHVVVGVGRRHQLPYAAVRFGNVLGSRGSVVPTFFRQILAGGPVTVTSEEMTRYFMSIPEAVSLVLQAGAMADGGRIFLLDMGEPASILQLARQMIRLAGLRPDDDIAIEITGPRPGERLHERLHDEAEEHEPAAHPSISVLRPKLTLEWGRLVQAMDELERSCRDDDEAVRAVIVDMLARCGVDCRLEPQPPTLGSSAGRMQSSERRGGLEVPERVGAAGRNGQAGSNGSAGSNGAPGSNGTAGSNGTGGPDGTVGRRRLALLSGVPGGAPEQRALPFVRPARPPLERVIERLTPSYESGQITNGALVRELEERMADRLRVAHVVAVSSCTSGLMLVVQALVDGRPGPVVLPSFTFSASAHAVAWNGRSPRFVECDPATFQMDLAHAEASLDGASALMATHVFGAPCAPELVEKLGASAGLAVVFDAAHAIGAKSNERPIGGFGDAEIFSLTPTKPMVAGEGGLIATRDSDLAARLRAGRDYGNPGDYDTRFAGLNARMSEFHAAMALESLGLLDGSLERRRELAARYIDGLRGVPGIRVQLVPMEHVSTYKDFTIAVDAAELGIDRNQLVAVLAAEGIDTRNYFDPPVHRQQAYRHGVAVDLPATDEVSRSVVSLPIYPDLSVDDVDAVVE
ncbi:MAG TPA: aminotransferase class I/II-fold pyridoxal phosphate-dependent enzyme, partial [Jiangellaceae bacterium]|nr:aminotransferase class I/II-fold pyridoxal phosphate-dependent enzyme [Jiangellaceae bacterium]